jgi:thiamine-monophosphate kinase
MLSKQTDNKPVKRSGAKTGDSICVTGSLGGSSGGRHLEFEPRVKEAIKIARMVTINSMIDISDGLSSDLKRICDQSGVGAIVNAKKIPISQQAIKTADPLGSALNDGEDFELLFTLSQTDCRELLDKWDEPAAITQIGEITDTGKMQIVMPDGHVSDLQAKGYEHLK